MYTVKQFLLDCYEVAEKQGAFKLSGEEHTKVCIQAFKYVLCEASKVHGRTAILHVVTSDNWTEENLKKDKNEFDTSESDSL